jgi:hypothetical protein
MSGKVAAWILLGSLLTACNSSTSSSTGTTGTVTVNHTAQATTQAVTDSTPTGAVPPGTKRVFFTGLDSAKQVQYGPVEFPQAPSHLLTGVPVAVQLIRIEYRSEKGQVLARAEVTVQVVAGAMTSVTVGSSTPQLTVEIVNDSGVPDGAVYVLLTGKAMAGVSSGISTLVVPPNPSQETPAGALTNLTPQGTVVSAYTGNTLPIYPFTVQSLTSGRVLVSYNQPITYHTTGAPTATGEGLRWDKIEFGFPGSGADLTSLDFFGIPMQFDYLDSSGAVVNTRTFYTSTPTLLQALQSLSVCMPAAVQRLDKTTGWNPNADDLTTFARVLGPQTLAALPSALPAPTPALPGSCPAQAANSPTPFPSFAAYLGSVVGGSPFTVTGSNGVGGMTPTAYTYQGTITSDGAGGYTIQLSGTMNTASPYGPPYGMDADNNLKQLPANLSVTVSLTAGQMDNYIYGATATSFTVTNLPADDLPYVANSVYANIAGDFIAALHFGYLGDGSKFPNGATWYTNPPTPYPFAGARVTNDGYYNPYAAVLYNLSDTYGFPYSDRGGRPSPYVPMDNTVTTLRITLLNDNRLDAPQATVSNTTNTSITVSWPEVPGAASYVVNVSYGGNPPYPAQPPIQTTGNSATITGLSPGTAYQIGVQAISPAPPAHPTKSSYVVPVYAVTTGTAQPLTPPTNSTLATFLTALNWGLNGGVVPSGTTFSINGASYTPGQANATINGFIGTNIFGLTVSDSAGPIYQGSYVVTLVESGGGFILGTPFFLSNNPNPLTQAGPPGTPPYFSTPGQQLVIGTAFAPEATKQFSPVLFPSP